MEVEMTLLGRDFVRSHIREVTPKVEIKSTRCVHRTFNETVGWIACPKESVSESLRHGFLCADHQIPDPKGRGVNSSAGNLPFTGDKGPGLRFSHFDLMRATIYKADGSPKYVV